MTDQNSISVKDLISLSMYAQAYGSAIQNTDIVVFATDINLKLKAAERQLPKVDPRDAELAAIRAELERLKQYRLPNEDTPIRADADPWQIIAEQGELIARLRAELEQARAERERVYDDNERTRYDIWALANEYGAETASVDPKDVEENIRALLRIGDRPPLVERQRRTIAALVVACRAAAKVMRENKDVLGMGLIWEWSGHIFEHYNPELFEDEDIETTHARLRAAGYDVEAFEARIREVIDQARVKRDEQQAKQAGE